MRLSLSLWRGLGRFASLERRLQSSRVAVASCGESVDKTLVRLVHINIE